MDFRHQVSTFHYIGALERSRLLPQAQDTHWSLDSGRGFGVILMRLLFNMLCWLCGASLQEWRNVSGQNDDFHWLFPDGTQRSRVYEKGVTVGYISVIATQSVLISFSGYAGM